MATSAVLSLAVVVDRPADDMTHGSTFTAPSSPRNWTYMTRSLGSSSGCHERAAQLEHAVDRSHRCELITGFDTYKHPDKSEKSSTSTKREGFKRKQSPGNSEPDLELVPSRRKPARTLSAKGGLAFLSALLRTLKSAPVVLELEVVTSSTTWLLDRERQPPIMQRAMQMQC